MFSLYIIICFLVCFYDNVVRFRMAVFLVFYHRGSNEFWHPIKNVLLYRIINSQNRNKPLCLETSQVDCFCKSWNCDIVIGAPRIYSDILRYIYMYIKTKEKKLVMSLQRQIRNFYYCIFKFEPDGSKCMTL